MFGCSTHNGKNVSSKELTTAIKTLKQTKEKDNILKFNKDFQKIYDPNTSYYSELLLNEYKQYFSKNFIDELQNKIYELSYPIKKISALKLPNQLNLENFEKLNSDIMMSLPLDNYSNDNQNKSEKILTTLEAMIKEIRELKNKCAIEENLFNDQIQQLKIDIDIDNKIYEVKEEIDKNKNSFIEYTKSLVKELLEYTKSLVESLPDSNFDYKKAANIILVLQEKYEKLEKNKIELEQKILNKKKAAQEIFQKNKRNLQFIENYIKINFRFVNGEFNVEEEEQKEVEKDAGYVCQEEMICGLHNFFKGCFKDNSIYCDSGLCKGFSFIWAFSIYIKNNPIQDDNCYSSYLNFDFLKYSNCLGDLANVNNYMDVYREKYEPEQQRIKEFLYNVLLYHVVEGVLDYEEKFDYALKLIKIKDKEGFCPFESITNIFNDSCKEDIIKTKVPLFINKKGLNKKPKKRKLKHNIIQKQTLMPYPYDDKILEEIINNVEENKMNLIYIRTHTLSSYHWISIYKKDNKLFFYDPNIINCQTSAFTVEEAKKLLITSIKQTVGFSKCYYAQASFELV